MIEESLEKVSKEFSHWEIFSEGEHYLPYILDRLMEVAPSYDTRLSIHAPISDINLGALSERMREAATMEILLTLECAAHLNVKMVTLHPGYRPMVMEGIFDSRAEEMTKKSLRIIDRLCHDYGVQVALENMPNFFMMQGRTVEEFERLLEGLEMGICFDIGHAHTVGQIKEFMEMKDRFINLHVHDNDGSADQHLTIGEGTAPIEEVIRDLSGYDGHMVIEAKSLDSAVHSRERLKEMLR
ncbi:MAG: hypothetical protein PWQ88_1055 [Candidatus Methanomethylophilaceae archaeon]|nr:hypothetical protein [Candidatus Methanomethylophilaceae archaeon]MDI3541332.1 hypothetical protein [Candidatus Methanomethylophilaceae archaeon]